MTTALKISPAAEKSYHLTGKTANFAYLHNILIISIIQ